MSGGVPEIEGVTDLVEIGRGGFGVVYRGIETEFGREVAVKVLMPSLDERARKRFERERRSMGTVSYHPNIVTVYRGGVASTGQPFLVMEYLPGGSLADHLQAVGPMDWRASATVGAKLADALSVAHQAGILHRDVKPANVFRTAQGEPKLGDFGIARLDDGNDSRTGSITASIAHAPPEIVDGARGDERSDLYSLASTVFELTMGAAPFSLESDTGLASMLSRIANEPPPRLHLEAASHEFENILARALSKQPDDRQATIAEFGKELRRAAQSPVTQPLPDAAASTVSAEPLTSITGAGGPARIDPPSDATRSVSVGQLGFLAALALLIAGFGGWAVARAAFGSDPETSQPAAAVTPTLDPSPVPLRRPTAVPTAVPTPLPTPEPTPEPAPTAAPTPDPDAPPDGFVTVSDATRAITISVPSEWATEIEDLADSRVEGGFSAGLSVGGGFLDFSGEPGVRDLTKSGVSVQISRLEGDIDPDQRDELLDGLLDIFADRWSDCERGERSELLHPQGKARFQILSCQRPDNEFIGAVLFMLRIDDAPGTFVPVAIQLADEGELNSLDVISFLSIDVTALPDI